jgi:hypothetical protein
MYSIMSSNKHTYYQEHRERLLQQSHENYVKNREKRLEYSRQYYQKHKERILEYDRQYYQKHKKQIYESQKDNQKQWKSDNRIKLNEYKRNWCRRKVEDEKANQCITVQTNWIVVFD